MNADFYLQLRKEIFNRKNVIREKFIDINIDENILSELWYRQEFDRRGLETIDGKKIIILSPGERNTYSYPDFVNAKVCVENKHYIGDVEIHKNRSDWFKHKHLQNKNYKNVILHVFYEYDTKRELGQPIFELCLKNKIKPECLYLEKINFPITILDGLCGKILLPKDYEYLENLLYAAAEARLVLKSERFNRLFITKSIEEQLLYEEICKVYGYVNNTDNFLLLSRLVPIAKLRKIVKSTDKNLQQDTIESIYFGVSGLLDNITEQEMFVPYIRKIYELWEVNKKNFKKRMNVNCWKLYKTRPINYPHRRIAALSRTITKFINFSIPNILFNILKNFDEKTVLAHIENIFFQPADGFFSNMCSFKSKPLKHNYPLFGKEKVDVITVNVVFPFYIYRARKTEDKIIYNKVLSIYKNIKSKERNKIVEKFIMKLVPLKEYRKYFLSKAIFIQGFIQLYKDFCEPIYNDCNNCYLVKILSEKITEKQNDEIQFLEL